LPIDADLRAIAVVGDQRVESEVFQMPADGGVRMLLVASSTADQTAAVSKAGLPSALLAVSGLRAGPLSPPAERKADGGLEAIGMGLVLAISALLFAAGCWRARGRPNRRHFEG
jgi:hypothetical protein